MDVSYQVFPINQHNWNLTMAHACCQLLDNSCRPISLIEPRCVLWKDDLGRNMAAIIHPHKKKHGKNMWNICLIYYIYIYGNKQIGFQHHVLQNPPFNRPRIIWKKNMETDGKQIFRTFPCERFSTQMFHCQEALCCKKGCDVTTLRVNGRQIHQPYFLTEKMMWPTWHHQNVIHRTAKNCIQKCWRYQNHEESYQIHWNSFYLWIWPRIHPFFQEGMVMLFKHRRPFGIFWQPGVCKISSIYYVE